MHSAHFSADASLLPVQMSVELIPYEELKWGRFLGRGAEGAVYAAWYLETPVAVKRPESKVEVEMNLHSGTPCHIDAVMWCLAHHALYSNAEQCWLSCLIPVFKMFVCWHFILTL